MRPAMKKLTAPISAGLRRKTHAAGFRKRVVNIPEKAYRALKAYCEKNDLFMSDVVEAALVAAGVVGK